MKICPVCGDTEGVRVSQAKGFWEGRVLWLLRVYPFRCRGCDARFLRWAPDASPTGKERIERHRTTHEEEVFAASQQSERFEDVIGEIRRAERERAEGSSKKPEPYSQTG